MIPTVQGGSKLGPKYLAAGSPGVGLAERAGGAPGWGAALRTLSAPHCKDSTKITGAPAGPLSASALLPTEAALPQAAPTAGHWAVPAPNHPAEGRPPGQRASFLAGSMRSVVCGSSCLALPVLISPSGGSPRRCWPVALAPALGSSDDLELTPSHLVYHPETPGCFWALVLQEGRGMVGTPLSSHSGCPAKGGVS